MKVGEWEKNELGRKWMSRWAGGAGKFNTRLNGRNEGENLLVRRYQEPIMWWLNSTPPQSYWTTDDYYCKLLFSLKIYQKGRLAGVHLVLVSRCFGIHFCEMFYIISMGH